MVFVQVTRPFFVGALALLLAYAPAYAEEDSGEVIFASYNLENYLRKERKGGGEDIPKPEKEIAALVRIIKDINPDILGISEIGPPGEFEDFKKRLDKEGLGYTHFEYVDGPDAERHVALLSRLPIVARQSQADVSFTLHGRQEKVKRGFLDVTVRLSDTYTLRLVGVHLKSKLAAVEGEALIRRNEAHLLREYVRKIVNTDPNVNLLLYGDFNDTKNEPAIHEIMGQRGAPDYLTDLWLKDEVGDHWTEYWKYADVYSRIDYIFVSRALLPRIVQNKCGIYRSPDWNEASDHRPIVATVKSR